MKRLDFQKGQTVYLFVIENSNAHRYVKSKPFEERIIQGTVASVGRKYITVIPDKLAWPVKFDVDDDFIQHVEAGSIDYMLFLSKQEIHDHEEAKNMYQQISNELSSLNYRGRYNLEKLRKIKEILKE